MYIYVYLFKIRFKSNENLRTESKFSELLKNYKIII